MGGGGSLLADAQSSADTALHSVRDLSHLLHPSALDDLVWWRHWNPWSPTFVAAMDRRRVRHDGMDGRRLTPRPNAPSTALFRKRSPISPARPGDSGGVQLAERAIVVWSIEDNGIGFDVADVERPGHGAASDS